MNFKEAVAIDIENVFFNTNELSETVTIDGRQVPIILDNDVFDKKTDIQAAALSNAEELIFIKAGDLKRLPNPGDQIKKDGKEWYVKPPVVSNMGVYEIRIGRKKL